MFSGCFTGFRIGRALLRAPEAPLSRPYLLRPLFGLTVTAVVLGASPAGAAPSAGPAGAQGAERASFIVTLRPGADPAATAAEMRSRGAEIFQIYSHALSGFAARVGPDLADQLRGDSRVQQVERDGVVRASGTQTNPTWGLDRIDQRSRPLDSSYTYDNTGAGVTVYVIDSGVRATHVEFAGRVAPGYTAINDGNGTSDCNGHGTHVAGTVAAATYGASKAVTVVPVRVLDCTGSGTMSGVIAGLDWVTSHHTAGAPASANLSLGGGANSSLDTALRNSISDGVTYTVSAGNDNVDACTASPARVAEALTVAASTSTDARASYSNWGSCVDLFAPGSSISSTYSTSDTATATMSGTSMAAPHVAGIAALYLSGAPAASPNTVNTAITNGATTNVITDTAGTTNRLAYSRLTPTGTIAVTPTATAPATPTAPTATGARRAIISTWTAPADGGSPITGYKVRVYRASDGSVVKTTTVSGSTLNTKVGGLAAGTAYYTKVQAINTIGTSAWSPQSNSATATR